MQRIRDKFANAGRGLGYLLKDPSVLLQAGLGLCAIGAGFVLKLSFSEWILVGICIVLVIAAEMINTVAEELADLYTKEEDSRVGKIKDMAAGMVLFVALGALVCGVIIVLRRV